MTAIWLLSTKGRPRDAQATVDACQEAGMTSPGVVYVDEDDGSSYHRIRLPKNWRIHYEPEWRSLQGSMQWCYETYPDASHYGWLADDTRPRTKGWDKLLEKAASFWGLAYAKDLWMSEIPGTLEQLENGRDLSSGLCWGGELVRTVGWWALPGVKQAGIDTAWTEIVRPFGLHRYVADVTVEHLNWRTGKRPYDAVDDWTRDGVSVIEADIATRNSWCASIGYRNTLRRLKAALGAANYSWEAHQYALRESYANEAYMRGGLPAARLTKIMEGEIDIDRIDGVCADADQGQA